MGVKIKRQLWECRGERFLIPDGTCRFNVCNIFVVLKIIIFFGGKKGKNHHHHHQAVGVVVVIVFFGFFSAGLPAGDKLIKNSGCRGGAPRPPANPPRVRRPPGIIRVILIVGSAK